MFGYAFSSRPSPSATAALMQSLNASTSGPAAAIARKGASENWGTGSTTKNGVPFTLVQSTPTTVGQSDATSGATAAAETESAEVEGADATSAATGIASGEATGASTSEAVSGASEETAVKDTAYCLKCHGPFEKLQARTKDYITEWDEAANPHQYVPHDSKTIVECTECHDPHAIPFKPSENARKPNVDYCYSCHHAQTLVNCNQCHKE